MKKISFIICLVIISVLLVGCKSKSDPEVISITFRITWDSTSGRGETIRTIVDDFNNSQDTVLVSMLGGDEDGDVIEGLLESETGPDVFVLPYRYIQSFGALDMLMTLNEDFGSDESNYYEAIFDLAKVDSKLYGMPWVGHSMCILYNKDILDTAGVVPSDITSYDAFIDALIQIEENTDVKGIGLVGANHHDLSWMTTQFINSFGGSLVNEDGTVINIDSQQTMDGLDYYINELGSYAQEGWEEHNGIDVMTAFRQEEVAFEIQGPWGITDIWKSGNPFEVGAISFARLGGYSEIGILMLAIKTNIEEEKVDAAIDFIEYMISLEALESVMSGEYSVKHQEYYPFRIPMRKDMVDSVFFSTFPEFSEFIYGFENPSVNTPIPEWSAIHTEYYIPGLHEVIVKEQTLEDFLEYVEEEGNKILNP